MTNINNLFSLPQILTFEEVWDEATKVLNLDIVGRYKKYFRKQIMPYSKAMRVLHERYGFYVRLLEGEIDAKETAQLHNVGHTLLERRLASAIGNTAIEAERIQSEIEKLCREVSAFCYVEFDSSVEERLTEAINSRSIGLEMDRIGDSDCNISGICVCSNGQNPPYLTGCYGDKTLLMGEERAVEILKEMEERKAESNFTLIRDLDAAAAKALQRPS